MCKITIGKSVVVFGMTAIMAFSVQLEARTVSEQEASRLASQFFASRGMVVPGTPQLVERSVRRAPGRMTAAPAYYVYNAASSGMDCGYVIVSGDDRALPVLGYSDSGTYDPANLPPAMEQWLDCLSAEIASLGDDTGTTYALEAALGPKIPALVACNWNQNAPFNLFMPIVGNGNRAMTGCVATAMAQVMYYHRWPKEATAAIPAYTTKTQNIERPALEPAVFDWSSMKDLYQESATGPSADAVAKLMLYCGQSVTMDYKNKSSSSKSVNIAGALQQYFNYAPSARHVDRSSYSKSDWQQLLYSELKAGRPVVYHGATMKGGGHSFVCDGYDNVSGLFHINWGWGGGSNGYYALSALTTRVQGIGSSEGTEGYIGSQGMVIGIMPANADAERATALMFSRLSIEQTTYTRAGSGDDFADVTFEGRFSNSNGYRGNFASGWALYKDGELESVLTDPTVSPYVFTNLEHGKGRTSTFRLTFGAGLESGSYSLVPISKTTPDGDWEECVGAEVNYLEAEVTETTLTLTPCGVYGTKNYKVNSTACYGYTHVGKMLEVVANITNQGKSMNDYAYLFVDDVCATMEMLDIDPGQTGDIKFFYRPEKAGEKHLVIALDLECKTPIANLTINVEDIPEAELGMQHTVQGMATSAQGRTLAGNTALVTTIITNKASTAYDEDVMTYLCRLTKVNDDGSYSGPVLRRVLTPLQLAAGATSTITLTFDGLVAGEQYFINYFYFSSTGQVKASGVSRFTVTGAPQLVGDVDGNGVVDIDDVNLLVNFMLRKKAPTADEFKRADADGDGDLDVDDLNIVINVIVKKV